MGFLFKLILLVASEFAGGEVLASVSAVNGALAVFFSCLGVVPLCLWSKWVCVFIADVSARTAALLRKLALPVVSQLQSYQGPLTHTTDSCCTWGPDDLHSHNIRS